MIPECRHIRPNGTKCRAAALRGNCWCYFHNNYYRERRAVPSSSTLDHGHIPVLDDQKSFLLDLPFIEDLSSIQLAIARVLQALALNQLDPKRAGLLLYGLQIAARNLPEYELSTFGTVTNVAHTPAGIPYESTGLRIPTPVATQPDLEDSEDDPEDEEDNDDDETDDQDDQEDNDTDDETRADDEDDSAEDITISKPEYPQSLKDLQSFVARLRVIALRQGMDPAIVYNTGNTGPNPAPAPTS